MVYTWLHCVVLVGCVLVSSVTLPLLSLTPLANLKDYFSEFGTVTDINLKYDAVTKKSRYVCVCVCVCWFVVI